MSNNNEWIVRINKDIEKLVNRVDEIERYVYEGVEDCDSLCILTRQILEIKHNLSEISKRLAFIEMEDRKSRNHILYMLIILFITLLINFITKHSLLEQIRSYIGL